MYQLQGASAYKKDLTNTHLLVDHLSNPHKKKSKMRSCCWHKWQGIYFPYVSICTSRSGIKLVYVSKDFRERIKINGTDITENFVCDFINDNKSFQSNDISFFEMSVGMAFNYFKEKVDIAIIEVGMGGRLDATNISPISIRNYQYWFRPHTISRKHN
jgi:dihydrofolate synthase/folylpolyglutamate synthase